MEGLGKGKKSGDSRIFITFLVLLARHYCRLSRQKYRDSFDAIQRSIAIAPAIAPKSLPKIQHILTELNTEGRLGRYIILENDIMAIIVRQGLRVIGAAYVA